MNALRILLALLLCAGTCQVAWADPAPAPGAAAPAASPAVRPGGIAAASDADKPRRPESGPAGGTAHPSSNSERTGTAPQAPTGGQLEHEEASAGSLSRNLLVALQMLKQRFQ
jgi:hypothetical protein